MQSEESHPCIYRTVTALGRPYLPSPLSSQTNWVMAVDDKKQWGSQIYIYKVQYYCMNKTSGSWHRYTLALIKYTFLWSWTWQKISLIWMFSSTLSHLWSVELQQVFFVQQDQLCIHFGKKKNLNTNIVFVCTSISPDYFIDLLLLSCRISTRVGGCYKSTLYYKVQSWYKHSQFHLYHTSGDTCDLNKGVNAINIWLIVFIFKHTNSFLCSTGIVRKRVNKYFVQLASVFP